MSKRLNWNQTASALRRGRVLMLTHANDGASYALDNGVGVSVRVGRDLTSQGDLFEGNSAPPAGDLRVVPNDDGLFPGMSQTRRVLS